MRRRKRTQSANTKRGTLNTVVWCWTCYHVSVFNEVSLVWHTNKGWRWRMRCVSLPNGKDLQASLISKEFLRWFEHRILMFLWNKQLYYLNGQEQQILPKFIKAAWRKKGREIEFRHFLFLSGEGLLVLKIRIKLLSFFLPGFLDETISVSFRYSANYFSYVILCWVINNFRCLLQSLFLKKKQKNTTTFYSVIYSPLFAETYCSSSVYYERAISRCKSGSRMIPIVIKPRAWLVHRWITA